MTKDCCKHNSKDKECLRKDGKLFNLPRRFTRESCKNPRGFTMRSSCAPYKFCNKTKQPKQSKQPKQPKQLKKSKQTKPKRSNKSKRTKQPKQQFLYNPDNPQLSFDVYIDKNPKDTIPIKYTTIQDVKNTIKKLETLFKQGKYNHKRIWQVGMILYVRLKVLKNKKQSHFKLADRYFKFLSKRTKIRDKDKKKQLKLRKQFTFTL